VELPFADAWLLLQPTLAVRRIAIPLTRLLLELLVVESFLLRAAPILLCGTSTVGKEGKTREDRCTAEVMRTVPLVLFSVAAGIVCMQTAKLGRLDWLIPRVHTRELMNREVCDA
jgi:hypothetical protein